MRGRFKKIIDVCYNKNRGGLFMAIILNQVVTFDDSFKKIIQGGNYEKVILSILNQSKKLLPNNFKHNDTQFNGECDFVDLTNNDKYDAKLLFTKKQGELIGSKNSDYEKWIQSMREMELEFGDFIEKRGKIPIETLKVYKVMEKRLMSVKEDENIILFIPYPIVLDCPNSVFTQLTGDILSNVFSKLVANKKVGERKVYFIYPCIDNCIVLRYMNTGTREYFSAEILKPYINYDISLAKK